MRTTYVMRDGELVEKTDYAGVDAPQVISDEMDATRHMADGKMYTSKQKFRQATKDAGCVEFGNEQLTGKRKPIVLDRRQRREDIKRAMVQVRDGMAPRIDQLREMYGKE